MDLVLVMLGGSMGALSRYLVSKMMANFFPFSRIPWGTPVVNITGSFFLSLLIFSFIDKGVPSRETVLLLGTGFLGAFTTFSTFTYESLSLLEEDPSAGFLYILANLILGFLGAYFGMVLGRGWKF